MRMEQQKYAVKSKFEDELFFIKDQETAYSGRKDHI